jgi:hypothetical protein
VRAHTSVVLLHLQLILWFYANAALAGSRFVQIPSVNCVTPLCERQHLWLESMTGTSAHCRASVRHSATTAGCSGTSVQWCSQGAWPDFRALCGRVPEECPQAVADLMAQCMDASPTARPSAKEVVALLSQPDVVLDHHLPPRKPKDRAKVWLCWWRLGLLCERKARARVWLCCLIVLQAHGHFVVCMLACLVLDAPPSTQSGRYEAAAAWRPSARPACCGQTGQSAVT